MNIFLMVWIWSGMDFLGHPDFEAVDKIEAENKITPTTNGQRCGNVIFLYNPQPTCRKLNLLRSHIQASNRTKVLRCSLQELNQRG